MTRMCGRSIVWVAVASVLGFGDVSNPAHHAFHEILLVFGIFFLPLGQLCEQVDPGIWSFFQIEQFDLETKDLILVRTELTSCKMMVQLVDALPLWAMVEVKFVVETEFWTEDLLVVWTDAVLVVAKESWGKSTFLSKTRRWATFCAQVSAAVGNDLPLADSSFLK